METAPARNGHPNEAGSECRLLSRLRRRRSTLSVFHLGNPHSTRKSPGRDCGFRGQSSDEAREDGAKARLSVISLSVSDCTYRIYSTRLRLRVRGASDAHRRLRRTPQLFFRVILQVLLRNLLIFRQNHFNTRRYRGARAK